MKSVWRKKPVAVEVVRLEDTDESIIECVEFVFSFRVEENGVPDKKSTLREVRYQGGILIDTLEGKMKASFGDYIIKGIAGEFYPCKPDIFHATYQRNLVWDDNI
jgi:hypothetical protein